MAPSKAIKMERGGVPLYARLSQILRARITSGEYKPKDMFPSEDEISRGYGVSRITVREALRILADQGIIIRQSGRGTFVASPGTVRAACSIDDLINGRQETRREWLTRRVLAASQQVSDALGVDQGERVIEMTCVGYAETRPFGLHTVTLPYRVGRGLSARRLGGNTVCQYLTRECGYRLSHVDQWTTASLADRDMAKLIGIPVGDPILTIRRIFVDIEGRVLEFAINKYRADGFPHHMRMKWEAETEGDREGVGQRLSGEPTSRKGRAVYGPGSDGCGSPGREGSGPRSATRSEL